MTPRRFGVLAAVAAALLLTGCTADPQPEPTGASSPPPVASSAPSPTPTPTPTALAVPPIAPGEIARAVFTEDGPDGVPETRSEILEVPEAGGSYSADAACVAAEPGARIAFTVRTAGVDQNDDIVLGAEGRCEDGGILVSSVVLDEIPVQVTITAADGVTEAYVRIIPTRAATP